MTQQTQVAVVGGGIVGCSVIYCLAKRGWTDVHVASKKGN